MVVNWTHGAVTDGCEESHGCIPQDLAHSNHPERIKERSYTYHIHRTMGTKSVASKEFWLWVMSWRKKTLYTSPIDPSSFCSFVLLIAETARWLPRAETWFMQVRERRHDASSNARLISRLRSGLCHLKINATQTAIWKLQDAGTLAWNKRKLTPYVWANFLPKTTTVDQLIKATAEHVWFCLYASTYLENFITSSFFFLPSVL